MGKYAPLEARAGRETNKHSPTGQWTDEAERLQMKSNVHVVLASHKLGRNDAIIQAHRIIWAAQMIYSMPIKSLSTKQLVNVQKKARQASFGKWPGSTKNTSKQLYIVQQTKGVILQKR